MGRPSSQADIMVDAEGLLEALTDYPDLQPSIEDERRELERSLEEVKDVKAKQQALTGQRQESTQLLGKALDQLRDAAIKVRAVLKGKIGPRNERLVHFKVAPIRRRVRKAPEKPPGEEPENPPPPPEEPVE